eukprot:TRINITY_DN40896_c0_g1_i1.p1 TRINITY_DN40896_c0_g1~~TRINITY_DN40896_c0_g1_i1.p1  ORF type:complete len:307 (+),score=40.82 TRINITY_DN40896_c0_g1_i1:53-973(+)
MGSSDWGMAMGEMLGQMFTQMLVNEGYPSPGNLGGSMAAAVLGGKGGGDGGKGGQFSLPSMPSALPGMPEGGGDQSAPAFNIPQAALRPGFKPKKICSFFLEGKCQKGLACTFAHSQDQLHPSAGAEAFIDSRSKFDWICPMCGDTQFARNTVCRKCATPNPLKDGPDPLATQAQLASLHAANQAASVITHPDLVTQVCSIHGKRRGQKYLMEDGIGGFRCAPGSECQTGGPGSATGLGAARPGMPNLAPGKELSPGDWICPGCMDHQFARNVVCRRCGTPRPEGAGLSVGGGKGTLGTSSRSAPY